MMKLSGIHLPAAACLLAFSLNGLAAQPVPVKAFFTHHAYSKPVLSPSGRYLAVVGPDPRNPNRNFLDIIDLRQMKVYRSFSLANREIFYRFAWKSDDRMALSTAIRTGGFDKPFPTGKIYVVDVPGDGLRLLQKNRSWTSYTGYRIIDPLWNDPDHIITASYSRTKTPHAYRVDLRHDMATTAARGLADNLMAHVIATSPLQNGTLSTDNEGHIRIATGYNKLTGARLWSYRDSDSNDWKPLPAGLFDPAMGTGPAGFMPNDQDIYLLAYGETGAKTLGIYSFNPATGKKNLLFADPATDIDGVMYGPDHHGAVALMLMPGRPKIVLLHQKGPAARILKAFSGSFPDEFPRIVSWTSDGSKAVVEVSSARDPGRFYLVNTDTLEAKILFKQRPSINPDDMAPVQPIEFKARDGMTIHGYLTLPPGRQPKQLPMIVFVHGGPFNIRDTWSFSPWVQFLANRGYAVLQVNFRGSAGYGWTYMKAGFHHWGTTMQYDVIDGTRWAVKQGYADPKRICIFGGSYGGFAALRSSELAPDLYRCTVGYDGVYDLPMMFGKGDITWFSAGIHYLHRVLGSNTAKLKAHSPVSHVDRLKSALFLIQGGMDRRAPPAQVDELKAALDKAGKPYKYLYKANEGHGFYMIDDQRELAKKLLAFFRRYIGG